MSDQTPFDSHEPIHNGEPPPGAENEHHLTRLQLVWQVLVFQVKLTADGIRDLLLVPVSLLAALIGLLTSRDDPGKYYKEVLKLGRRSEHWINLFGYRKGRGTSDEMLEPLQAMVMAEAERNPHLRRANHKMNQSLDKSIDSVSDVVEKKFSSPPDHPH